MNKLCKVCMHPERERINLHLVRGIPCRIIAKKFDVSRHSVWRHGKSHLPPTLRTSKLAQLPETELDLDKLRVEESERYLQNLVMTRRRIWALIDECESYSDYRAASALYGRLNELAKMEGHVLGEINSAANYVTNNNINAPLYLDMRSIVIEELKDFPELRTRVAQRLYQLEEPSLDHTAK